MIKKLSIKFHKFVKQTKIMRINKENTLAVIIDIQERLYPFIYENEKLTENIIKLIKGLKVLGTEFIITEQYSKGLGHTVSSINELVQNDLHIEKMSFSCCGSDEFLLHLKNKNKKNIVISGIESHVCVLQTVIDLINLGFQPVLIEDCVSSRNINDKNVAVARMRKEGAVISTYESILFELCEVSGTPVFKEISKLVK